MTTVGDPTPRDSAADRHADQIARLQAAHLAEVVSLRRKIEALEHALAKSEAARHAEASARTEPSVTSIDLPVEHSRRRTDARTDTGSAMTADGGETPDVTSAPTAGTPWDDGDATFAERMAARAFFREEEVDQRARRWLLRET